MIYKLTMTAEARVNIRNTSITVNGRAACYREKGEKSKGQQRWWRNLLCHLKALQLIDSRAFIAQLQSSEAQQLSKRNSVQINAKANLVVKTFRNKRSRKGFRKLPERLSKKLRERLDVTSHKRKSMKVFC